MVKAAFFDIDGTLVGFNSHRISDEDLKALEELRRRGIKIIIATGRHISFVNNIPYPVDGIISCNGALTYLADGAPAMLPDPGNFTTVSSCPFSTEVALKIARIAADNAIPTIAYLEKRTAISACTDVVMRGLNRINIALMPQEDITETLLHEKAYALCTFANPVQEAVFSEMMPLIDATRWCDEFIDVNVKGMSKAVGVRNIADALGIGISETIAFGDGGNDLTMIRCAATGVAMGNASDDIKAAADFVTSDVESSGVAYALKALNII